jgi:chromate transporter
MLFISGRYERFSGMELFRKTLEGVLPAVVGLVAAAAWNLGSTSLNDTRDYLLLVAGFSILQFTRVSPMVVILGAGALGYLLHFS